MKNVGCWNSTTSLFSLSETEGTCRKGMTSRMYERAGDKRCFGRIDALEFDPGKLGDDDMRGGGMEEAVGADNDNVRETWCISEVEDKERKVIYDFCELLSGLSGDQGKKLAENCMKILHHKYFKFLSFKEVVKSYKDCEMMMNCEKEKLIEKIGFVKNEISVTLGRITMARVVYKRSLVDLLRMQLILLGGDNIALRPHSDKSERFDINHPMNGFYFRGLYEMQKKELMRGADRERIRNETLGIERQSFVAYVQVISNKTATSLMRTVFVAYPVHAVLLTFTYSSRRQLVENGDTVVGYLLVNSEMAKEVGQELNDEERSSRYWFTGSKVIVTEKCNSVGGELTTDIFVRTCCMQLLETYAHYLKNAEKLVSL